MAAITLVFADRTTRLFFECDPPNWNLTEIMLAILGSGIYYMACTLSVFMRTESILFFFLAYMEKTHD